MTSALETLSLLAQIALRNLFASRLKTLIVGGIIGFGALLVVLGTSLLQSANGGMRQSIVGSAAGHIQVYNAASRDELALYGGMSGDPDLEPIEDFAALKRTLLEVPNVKSVIPMGAAEAMGSSGNQFDKSLEKLRATVRTRLAGGAFDTERYQAQKDHVRRMITLLEKDSRNADVIVEEGAIDKKGQEDLRRAVADEFWASFDADPLGSLEFLENRIAPLSLDGDFVWVRYIGTDLEAYRQAFDRFEIVEGAMVPPGQRGILLGKLYYEDFIKLKTARRLDQIKEARDLNGKRLADDEELQRFVKENTEQVRDLVIQLDAVGERELVGRLQKALGSTEGDISKLLVTLLETDDANFDERYRIFYEEVAPRVELYPVRIGDFITIKAPTKSGYLKSVNVKVYGICQFRGLEKSGFAGIMSLMDLMTFRDLYGYLTADKLAEIQALQQKAGVQAIARENAEDAMFGAGATLVQEAQAGQIDLDVQLDGARQTNEETRVYSQEEIECGVALSAAVVLEDPDQLRETMAAIDTRLKGAGFQMRVVDWQKAAGMVGQFITLIAVVLFVVILIVFAIALVVINNSMVMATLQRIKEIGTLRAIGAQRRFVLGMICLETLVVGLLFGALGALLGAGAVELLGSVGIPATSQEAYFLFSGPRLYPHVGVADLVIAFVVVFVVAILSGLYPALLATRITPLEAMLSEE